MPPNDDVLIKIADLAQREPAGTLASSVYDRLRGDILSGSLPPGEKLRTEALRARYEVGNSPIREALNRLSADGLVTREDQKGFRVAAASRADLEELVKTRCWLEQIALRESIANGDDVLGRRDSSCHSIVCRGCAALRAKTIILLIQIGNGCIGRFIWPFCRRVGLVGCCNIVRS